MALPLTIQECKDALAGPIDIANLSGNLGYTANMLEESIARLQDDQFSFQDIGPISFVLSSIHTGQIETNQNSDTSKHFHTVLGGRPSTPPVGVTNNYTNCYAPGR
tara:strand:+ start:520 stop:837 length:318 start_codon:yes stop_codon:yes gene_type:complete